MSVSQFFLWSQPQVPARTPEGAGAGDKRAGGAQVAGNALSRATMAAGLVVGPCVHGPGDRPMAGGRRGPAGGIGARRSAALVRGTVIVALIGACLPALARDEPTAPSKLSARIVDNGVELLWDAPAVGAGSVTGYEILRRKSNRNEPGLTLVSDTGNRDTTYTDETATEVGVSYVYRVKAIRGSERSAWSSIARVTVLPTPTLLVGNLGQTSASAEITQQHATGFPAGRARPGLRNHERRDRPGRRAVEPDRLAVDQRPVGPPQPWACAAQAVRLRQPGLLQGRREQVHGARRSIRLPERPVLDRALGIRLVGLDHGDGLRR